MKRSKLSTGNIEGSKFLNQKAKTNNSLCVTNNKIQKISNQNNIRQILLKFKTQKCSPKKTPTKSSNKISNENSINNTEMMINNIGNKEIKVILSNTKNMHELNNILKCNNKNNYRLQSTKQSPGNIQKKNYMINNKILNNTLQILTKQTSKDNITITKTKNNFVNNKSDTKTKKQNNINKNKINIQTKNINIKYRNNDHTYNSNSINSNTNNTNNTNSSISNVINYSTNCPVSQFAYPSQQKKKIILQTNKSFKQKRAVIFKNCNNDLNNFIINNEKKYINSNFNNTTTTPITMNNSRKNSVERKLKDTKKALLNYFQTNKNCILTNISQVQNSNHSKTLSSNVIQSNLNYNINQKVSTANNFKLKVNNISKNNKVKSKDPFTVTKNSINKNFKKYQSGKMMTNLNKVNYTTSNSPSKYLINSLNSKIKEKKNTHKIYIRSGNDYNLNDLNIKVPHLTSSNLNNNELNICSSSCNKTHEIKNLSSNKKNDKAIVAKNLINNKSFNYFLVKNNIKDGIIGSKIISHKQSLINLLKESENNNNSKNKIINNNTNIISPEKKTKHYSKKFNNKKTHIENNQTNILTNNASSNMINKITPKIIDIKKCSISNNNYINKDINNIKTTPNKTYNTINTRPNSNNNKRNNKKSAISNQIETKKIGAHSEIRGKNIKNKNRKIESKSNSVSKSKPKSTAKNSKSKYKSKHFSNFIEEIKIYKKNNIKINTSNNSSVNKSNKSSLNNSKNIFHKRDKSKSEYNSNSSSVSKNNTQEKIKINKSTSINFPDFESELSIKKQKEIKNKLIKEGTYYSKLSLKLSKYIIDYYKANNIYPKTQINFYKYGRLIGKGAFGKVNIGLHVLTGKIVAIKSFNKKKFKNERSKQKIIHEIELMKNLRHFSVVKLLDYFETKNYLLIIMENISGGDLLTFVKKRTKLTEKICKFIFKQLLISLKFIHNKNIIHRDIKLDNILIDLNNNIKLCDFGVGKQIHENELLKEQCGTPAYIAPEILENKGYEGPPVDIWSSGIVLYAMLSGNVPFKANNLSDLHTMIISGNFKELSDKSIECNDLLHKLLEVDPKKRISIEDALKHPWFFKDYNLLEENKMNLFTKAEKILLSKNIVDYRNCNKDERIENFTLQNLDTKNIIENKNNATKSIIFAPFNTSYSSKEINISHLEEGLLIENNDIFFDEKINVLNRQYELNNNEEIDHGVLINHSNLTSRSTNNDNLVRMNAMKKENDNPQNSIEENKKILSNNNSKKKYLNNNINKEMPNRNQGNNVNTLPSTSSTIIFDENILKTMEVLGYKKEYVQKCIANNEVNYCSATYYLLCSSTESVA